MPPLCRKKKVIERYNPDTFRVISYVAEETHPKHDAFEEGNKPSEWRRQWLENEGLALPDIYNRKTEVLPHPAPDYRSHKPHPGSCGFLRHNVRLLNEPICSVYTQIPVDDQQHWWPSRVSNEPLQIPPRTSDTIYRSDFLDHPEKPPQFGSNRHTANPNKEPALGTVPVNFLRQKDGSQKFYKEKVSYEHQYNSRIDPNYPIRAKRHGSFVWDPMPAETTKKFINHYSVISAEEGARRQENIEADKLATEAANLLEGTNFEEPPQESIPVETQVMPEPEKVVETAEKQPSPKGSKKSSPAQSGQVSPKQPSTRKNSCKPGSPKKASSRKGSVSNGQKSSEKCNDLPKTGSIEAKSVTEVTQEASSTEQQKATTSEE